MSARRCASLPAGRERNSLREFNPPSFVAGEGNCVNALSVEKIDWLKPGQAIAASGRIPESSEFFQDHFPDFPVLPGVLALEILKRTAGRFLESAPDSKNKSYRLKEIQNTKFSLYLKPGDAWESLVELISEEPHQTQWEAKLFHEGKTAVSTRFILSPHPIASSHRVSQGGNS